MLSRVDLRDRILQLPEHMREQALQCAEVLYSGEVDRSTLKRDPEQRRAWANDPEGYVETVFGYELTDQEREVLRAMRDHDKLLVPAARGVGKSWILGLGALWRFDCCGAILDENGREQGARILLPGPDHGTILHTIYEKILLHAQVAERRGYAMPGDRSELSVHWRVPGHPDWCMEAMSPPKSVGMGQAHQASGRHHRNQHAFFEECAGAQEPLWRAIEGQCSGDGNSITGAYNPTEPSGPAVGREKSGSYFVLRLSALNFPNVIKRASLIPGAVGYKHIDEHVRIGCTDLGPYPGTLLDEQVGDFVYALPPAGAEERGGRTDGIVGHPDGVPRVYRPGDTALVSILGKTAAAAPGGLFSADSIDRAFARYLRRSQPSPRPDRVACDAAREGACDATAAPAWGDAAEHVLRQYLEQMEQSEPKDEAPGIRIGHIVVLRKGDGPTIARELFARWRGVPISIDDGGQGVSVYDHLNRVLHAPVEPVTFGAAAPAPLPGLPWCVNLRTWMYVTLAALLNWDLVDIAPDETLKAELLAHETTSQTKVVDVDGLRRTVSAVALCHKDEIIKQIGRSPDRSDVVVLAAAGHSSEPRLPKLRVFKVRI